MTASAETKGSPDHLHPCDAEKREMFLSRNMIFIIFRFYSSGSFSQSRSRNLRFISVFPIPAVFQLNSGMNSSEDEDSDCIYPSVRPRFSAARVTLRYSSRVSFRCSSGKSVSSPAGVY